MPVIGSMILQPGQSTLLSMQFMMHGDMGGQHVFKVIVPTNDPEQPVREIFVKSNWVP
jgi:hypothetical protein